MNASKPEVLHLVSSFHQGGSERQALQLVRLLRDAGRYRLHLATLRDEGVLRSDAASLVDAISEYPLTGFYNSGFFAQLARFARNLRRNRISVVHTHDFYSNVFGMAAAALAGVPLRIASRRETGGIRTPAQKTVERWSFRLAHIVIANAAAIGDQLASEGIPRRKVVTVYNGIDVARLHVHGNRSRRELETILGLPHDPRRYVTIVANMRHAVKDQLTFLRSAKEVAAAVPDAAFILAGEGELQPVLQTAAAELGLADRAIFLGRCEQVGALLALSDVCVLSSRAEGFPNAVLEYMAAERAVVSTDVGGVREVLSDGETGYIVPVGDAGTMAARIVSLLSNPSEARAMGRSGRKVVEQRFSCEAQLSRTESLYAGALQREKQV